MKTICKPLLLSMMLVALSASVNAQLVVGGTISADYRNDGYYIEFAPKVGYKYKIFESGIGPFLSYFESSDYLTYGVQIYTQADIYKGVFLHGEFQAANVYVASESGREWVMGLPLGIGYQYEVMDKVWLKGSVLYDVLYKEGFSPQKNPIFRFGIYYSL